MGRKRQWAEKPIPPETTETCVCGAPATHERICYEGRKRRVEHYCDDCSEAISLTKEDLEEMT